jgi:hypothetical protein
MKSAKEIQKQLVHLVNTIPSCNFISQEDRKDIVGNSMLQILKKYNEGKVVDDFETTKGYCFITLRNYCIQHRKKNKVIISDSDFSHITEDNNTDDTEYNEHLKKLIRGKYTHHKLKPEEAELCELILNDYNNTELAEKYGLTLYQLGRKKHTLALRLKYIFNKPSRYFILDTNNKYYKIGCLTANDVLTYFPTENLRNIREKIYNGKQFKDGRYVIKNEEYEKEQEQYLEGKKFR